MPTSQVSPAPRIPSPHSAGQSLSTAFEAPAGQHPSFDIGNVIAVRKQIAEQVRAEMSCATTQAFPAVQSNREGQAPAVPGGSPRSQVSPGSTTPFPQVGEQSGSVVAVAPVGQQPSETLAAIVISVCEQAAVQPLPLRVSLVQARPSSQLAGGQAPGRPGAIAMSQVSLGSTAPLPQFGCMPVPPSGGAPVEAGTHGLPPSQVNAT